MLFYSLLDLEVTILGIIVSTTEKKHNSHHPHFLSNIYTSPLAGTIFVYTLGQSRNREKFFLKQNIRVKRPTLVGNKQIFHPYP